MNAAASQPLSAPSPLVVTLRMQRLGWRPIAVACATLVQVQPVDAAKAAVCACAGCGSTCFTVNVSP